MSIFLTFEGKQIWTIYWNTFVVNNIIIRNPSEIVIPSYGVTLFLNVLKAAFLYLHQKMIKYWEMIVHNILLYANDTKKTVIYRFYI